MRNRFRFFKWAILPSFSFIFVFLIQLIVNKICRCLDSNSRTLVSETTTLPTEPQPLAKVKIMIYAEHHMPPTFSCVYKSWKQSFRRMSPSVAAAKLKCKSIIFCCCEKSQTGKRPTRLFCILRFLCLFATDKKLMRRSFKTDHEVCCSL